MGKLVHLESGEHAASSQVSLSGETFRFEGSSAKFAFKSGQSYVNAVEISPTQISIGANVVWHSGSFNPSNYMPTSWSLTAGNGLQGGGNGAANRSINLGTPSNITLTSGNATTSESHTHNFAPGGSTTQLIRGDGTLINYVDQYRANLSAANVYTLTSTSSTFSGQYTKVATVTCLSQYATAEVLLAINESGSGQTIAVGGLLTFRVKQQAAIGDGTTNTTGVSIEVLNGVENLMGPSRWFAVVTNTGSYPVTVDLYMQGPSSHTSWSYTPLNVGRGGNCSIEFFSNTGYVETLPNGANQFTVTATGNRGALWADNANVRDLTSNAWSGRLGLDHLGTGTANSTTFLRGDGTWAVTPTGVTNVSAGNGMTFSAITGTGAVALGTPSNITLTSSNSVTSDSHTHNFVPGGTTAQYIRGDGSLAAFPTIPDTSSFVQKAGDTMTGELFLAPSTASRPPLNLGHGVAVTAFTNGDLWMTSAGLFGRVNGVTQQYVPTTGSVPTLTTARTIAISGIATGTATSFNGSANITIPITALNLAASGVTGQLPVARMGTGTASSSTFLRGDGTWAAVTASSIPWANVTNKDEVWINNMTGARDFSNGWLRARGNAARIQVFDDLLDVPDVELGAGWNNGTDGVGYIINRRESHPLRLAGRNASMYLGLGEGDRMSILHNSALQLTSNPFIANAVYGVQNVALSMRWNGNPIWQVGTENNGDFQIWAYTDVGAYLGVRLQMKGDGRVAFGGATIGADHYSALTTFGGIKSRGYAAALGFDERSGDGNEWNWYANGGTARLWYSGSGDLIYVDGSGLRASSGLNQGATDAGWNLRWNVIAPGVGASEYINQRQGGSGGHLFATRQNEGQTPQQHHHLLSNGRMNIRTANGNWIQQPRIFSGGGDPGGAADPGDLWFQEV